MHLVTVQSQSFSDNSALSLSAGQLGQHQHHHRLLPRRPPGVAGGAAAGGRAGATDWRQSGRWVAAKPHNKTLHAWDCSLLPALWLFCCCLHRNHPDDEVQRWGPWPPVCHQIPGCRRDARAPTRRRHHQQVSLCNNPLPQIKTHQTPCLIIPLFLPFQARLYHLCVPETHHDSQISGANGKTYESRGISQ